MTDDGSRIFNAIGTSTLRYSDDECATWTDVHAFTDSINAVRTLPNGEMLVATANIPSGVGTIWVSSGFPANPATATWDDTLTSAATGSYFADAWSLSVHGAIVLAAEYGPKSGGTGNARYVYLSTDYGQTWATIWDVGSASGSHVHGVAYDPWWDRIWVTYGDDTSGLVFSDDLGDNWTTAYSTAEINGPQWVGIHPTADRVFFASDCAPNGIYRIDRTEGKANTSPTVELAHQIDASASLAWLGMRIWQDPTGAAVFFPFQPTNSNRARSVLIATADGETFHTIWSSMNPVVDKGVVSVIGPTADDQMFVVDNDGQFANYTRWVGPFPNIT